MIGSDSFARKGKPAGSSDRIAIPVAADRDKDREVAMTLVEDSGLDAVYSGTIADSWRQQPGAPAYCTDLTRDEMPDALAAADKARLPRRRDLAVGAFLERMGDPKMNPDADFGVRVSRTLFM
ncbi:NADP oxidoreductase [Mesorhizobium sp. A556]